MGAALYFNCQHQSKDIGDQVKELRRSSKWMFTGIIDNPQVNKNDKNAKPINVNPQNQNIGDEMGMK